MLFVGDCTRGTVGGGFLYTNKEFISLGLVATIKELSESDTTIYQVCEDFENHPAAAPIIRDAKMVEHSGHMVSEGGFCLECGTCRIACEATIVKTWKNPGPMMGVVYRYG